MKQFFAKTHLLLALVLFSLFACKPAAEPVAGTAPQATESATSSPVVAEPKAGKRPFEITEHGDTRVDEYYWLRDDTRSDPEVLAYLEAENQYFESQMAHTEALQKTLFDEMTGRLDPDDSSVPYEKNGYWYYNRYEPGKDYAIYARRKGSMDAAEEILVDGNQRAEGHSFYQLMGIEVSDDHRYVAIAEDTVGRRINTIRVLDTQTGEFLPEADRQRGRVPGLVCRWPVPVLHRQTPGNPAGLPGHAASSGEPIHRKTSWFTRKPTTRFTPGFRAAGPGITSSSFTPIPIPAK